MKFINKHFVSREYYEGACTYYQKEITRLAEENKLYETKLRKITECMGLLQTAITDVDCNLRTFAYKLGRILDDHEMF